MPASFEQDLATYRVADVEGIGLLESKLAADPDAARKLRESGLEATNCVPTVPSILPSQLIPGPSDPRERVQQLCASVRRFAEFDPVCVVFVTGPDMSRREDLFDGLRRLEECASDAGVRLALEPGHPSLRDDLTFLHSAASAVELLDDADVPSIGILVDVWHLWESPSVLDEVSEHRDRIRGVHISDWRRQTRSPFDRAIPGEGVIPLGPLLRQLDDSGYDGYYDIEIFSDNGKIADRFHDSLWDLDPEELVQRARAGFLNAWSRR